VTGTMLNHPVINLGYRVDCNGKSVFFTGDHEPYINIYQPDDEGYAEYQRVVEERQAQVDEAMRGADVLIADSSYTREEYPPKIGWGHGTFDHSLEMARRTGAKKLVCTHHEPTRTDADLERAFEDLMARYPRQEGDPEIMLSYEGLEIEV
jgi:phosphoribosyl 1,2-cyclic phosphodiesterase